jgi:hypothetical protein
MAVVKEFLSNKLVTRLNYGLVNGKEVIKSKSYANVKQTATIAEIHQVATAIAALQDPVMEEVYQLQQDRLFDDGQ